MIEEFGFSTVEPARSPQEREAIIQLLRECGLGYEEHIEVFVVCRRYGRLVACAGLESNIVKCVAIEPDLRGDSISLQLMTEITRLAYDRGYSHLFLYTRPGNVELFQGCGFYPLAEVPHQVTLMENTSFGIGAYCSQLRATRKSGTKIGGIVVNANPFTLGHRYLVETAASECDWIHLFVVKEDVSFIAYLDRYELVSQGVKDIRNLTLHQGSAYIISRATFPEYFYKEKEMACTFCTAIDLLLFRNYIAPALGITDRFVGTEPFCPVTCQYNADMKYWLETAPSSAPPVMVREVPRAGLNGTPISASEVRRLLRAGDMEAIRPLVPPATYKLLRDKYLLIAKATTHDEEARGARRPAPTGAPSAHGT